MDANESRALEMRLAAAAEARRDLAIVQPRLDALRTAYVEAWRASQANQTDAREQLWLAYQAVEAIERDFRAKIADAQAAQAELDLINGGRA